MSFLISPASGDWAPLPPWGCPWQKHFESIDYDFMCLQIRLSKWVTVKLVFLKELWLLVVLN
jgi:hypothetical protein